MLFRSLVFVLVLVSSVRADALRLEVLSPEGKPPLVVTHDRVNVAARTAPGATASVGGVPCPVYSTGIFVRDGIPLQPGANAIRITVTAPGGKKNELMLDVRRDPPLPPKLTPRSPITIEPDSIKPDKDVALVPGDELEVAFNGSAGRLAELRFAGGMWQRMIEDPAGHFRASLVTTHVAELAPAAIELRLFPENQAEAVAPVMISSKAKLALWSPAVVRQAVVTRDIGTDLVWGLHEVRLGGPAVGRMPQGTVLRIIGQRGGSYRVRLTPQLEAWVEMEHVKLLPPGTPVARETFTNVRVKGEVGADRVEIPWDAHIPFAVTPDLRVPGRPALDVDLYGAQHGTTWIVHHAGLAAVTEVSLEQVATDHVRMRVELGTRLWGWKVDVANGTLVLSVRGAPHIVDANAPLKGFSVVVEAGHGGSNEGASGLMKVFEKEITLKIADLLAAELAAAGARVSKIRTRDELVSMEDRAKRALKSDALLFVSIHCNSGESAAGFLKTGGTSTFYKHATARDLARSVYAAMLSDTGLPDYGSIGNFNYYPIRALSWMPAVLVETAFLSNPFEEAKLLDPAFEKTVARAVKRGVEDFLKQVAAGQ